MNKTSSKKKQSVKQSPQTVGAKEYNDFTEEFNRELPQLT